jgi:hypothetical protein
MADRITLKDCTVSDNNKNLRVRTVDLGHGSAVVWNKTERGTCCTFSEDSGSEEGDGEEGDGEEDSYEYSSGDE